MSDWYVTRGEQERGPLSWDQVRKFAATGKLRRDDLLREGFGFGRPAGEYEDLPFPDPNAAPAPTPVSKAALSSLGWRRPERPIEPKTPPSLGPISIPMFLAGTLFLVVALAGWVRWAESNPPRLVQLPMAPAPQLPPLVMPSDEEAHAFGDMVVQSFQTGDPKEDVLIDYDALGERAVLGLPVPPQFHAGMVGGMKKAGLFARLRQTLGADTSVRVLRVREVGNEKQVLVRVLGEGVNYLEFILTRTPGGQVRAVDIYVYASGERFSETMRTVTMPVALHENRSLLEKLQGKEHAFIASFSKFEAMGSALKNGDHARVLTIYSQLPQEVQQMKIIQLLRYQAALEKLEGAEFIETIDDMRRVLGDDPRQEILFLDRYILTKQFDRALAGMTRLYAETGDPYMRVLRADVYAEQGKLEMAIQEAREAIREEPDLTLAWLTLVHYQIAAEKFDDALVSLKEMLPLFGHDYAWRGLFTLDEYAPFRDTPQYEAWETFLKETDKSPAAPVE